MIHALLIHTLCVPLTDAAECKPPPHNAITDAAYKPPAPAEPLWQ